MIAEIGHFALVLALGFALFQVVVPLVGAQRGDHAMMNSARPAALLQLGFIAIAFAALTQAFVTSDFSVALVWQHSYSTQPLIYKISAVWGNHEGSMVLWVMILAIFGAAVALFGGSLPPALRARVLSVQAMIGVAFLLFIVATSNPFARLDPAPFEGTGLNPILQDLALAVHPPLLYAGYVGFSMAFSFAVAALIEGRVDAAWARWVRPWTLAAWMFLTIGIAMGSWWAYYELGWGGWWFWDPVENASFMPWLVGTALLHSAIVVERRDALKTWTILLSILAFSLSLVGTFLVRSGVLTSVHAFAVDPERGVFILAILCLFIGGALTLFAWRAPVLKGGGLFAPVSRETALVLNNLLLTSACATVFIGTLYPLALEAVTGEKISVGPPFFNATFVPLIMPLLMLMPIGPLLAWKRGDLMGVAQRLLAAAAIVIVVVIATHAVMERGPVLAPLGVGLAAWLIAGALSETAYRVKLFNEPLPAAWRRARSLPRSAWGTTLAHAGVGVLVLGVVAVTAWRQEKVETMVFGQTVAIGGADVTFDRVEPRIGPNYRGEAGIFTVKADGRHVITMAAEKRVYTANRQPTTEAAIYPFLTGDLYVVLGDEDRGGSRTVRLYFNPLAPLIWIGALIMFIGGAISLSDRRYRVGAPRLARGAGRLPAPAE
jgi:cytochrome c-type biogenesis protein CcmF